MSAPLFAPWKVLEGHKNWLTSCAVFHDGKRVVTASDDRKAIVWEVDTGQELHELAGGHEKEITSVAVFPDGQKVITGSRDKTAIIWKLLAGDSDAPFGVGVGPSLTTMAMASSRGGQHQTARILLNLEQHTSEVWSVDVFPSCGAVVTGGIDRRLIIWDATTGMVLTMLETLHENWITSTVVFPHSDRIFTGSADGLAVVIKVDQLQHRGGTRTLEVDYDEFVRFDHVDEKGIKTQVYAVAVFNREQRVIVGCLDKKAIIWDLHSSRQPKSLVGHAGPVYTVDVARDESFVCTGSFDRKVILWDPDTCNKQHVLECHQKLVLFVRVFPKSDMILSASGDMKAIIWNRPVEKLYSLETKQDAEDDAVSIGSGSFGDGTESTDLPPGTTQKQSVLRKSVQSGGHRRSSLGSEPGPASRP